jgi:hypothetical protein
MAIDVKQKPRRLYKTADGKRVPGVTTILNNIGWKTPGLVWWAFRLGQAEPDMNSPYDKTDEAADIGTVVHRAVELLMHGLPDAEAEKHIADNLPPESIRQAENCLLAFYQWRDGFRLEVTDTEVALVSEDYRYGGTLDYVARVAGARVLVDLKTASGVYPDTWAQLAAYGQLWNENHPGDPVMGYYVLRIDKESAGFDNPYRPDLTDAFQAFVAARKLHDLKARIK